MSGTPLHFAHPELVWIVWVWLALVLLIGLQERRGGRALDRLVGLALQGRLVERPSRWRRAARIGLLGISGLAMAIALMQPQWGERHVSAPRVGAEIMIALDVSRSMLADDARPSRLERAKAEVRDLLGYLGDDHVGLIAFAGRASVLSPMTPDKSFLRLALDGAGPHSVSRGGTRLAEPIQRAIAGLGEPGPAQRALILITDGEDHDSFALDAAKAAAEVGIKIIAIGFGDEGGSPIYVRDPKTGARTQVRDADGQPVISRLNGELLRELALVTDGAFVPAGTGVLDLASIYDAHIAGLTRGQLDERGRTIRDEVYQAFALLGLVCLVAAVLVSAGPIRGEGGRGEGRRSERMRREGTGSQGAGRPGAGSSLGSSLSLSLSLSLPLSLSLSLALVALAGPPAAEAQGLAGAAPEAVSIGTSERGGAGTAGAAEDTQAGSAEATASAASPVDEAPRVTFNRGVEALAAGDAVGATTLFRAARREAASDVELRHAATYNLGMAAVARADGLVAENPREALAALHEAADWFREASATRPDESDARHNLDVTLRRALMLSDELARAEEGEIESLLDALIESQRARVTAAAGLLEEVARADDLGAADRLRPAFEDAATEQRVLLSAADELADRIARERDAIALRPEQDRTPEEALRAAQLDGALVYLDSALDRMGQTRRQLRQRRAERSYRRGSAALGELKRARDQLRDPVQQIGVLLEEVARLGAATGALASRAAGGVIGGPSAAAGSSAPAPLPAFLTAESLEEESQRLENRVRELGVRLEQASIDAEASAAADAAAPAPMTPQPAGPAGSPSEADRAALRRALAGAAPRVVEATQAMESATQAISDERFTEALGDEARAGQQLARARELFFDLRQLLDVSHADESRIAELAGSEQPERVAAREEYAPLLRELQERNLARAARLVELLASERAARLREIEAQAAEAAEAAPMPSGAQDDEADPAASEQQRFDRAAELLASADGAMAQARDALGTTPEVAPDWPVVAEASAHARDQLDAIRTLFFTIVEHLRQLALDQVDTRDATQDAIALAVTESAVDAQGEPVARGPETQARATALAAEQAALEARAGVIADALLEQSEKQAAQPTPEPQAPAPAPAPAEGEAESVRLREAAEHVAQAQLAMRAAQGALSAQEQPLDPAPAEQQRALEALAAALERLSPPPPPEQEQEQGEQPEEGQEGDQEGEPQPQEQSGESGQDDAAPQPQPESPDAGENAPQETREQESMGDPSQLLQGVRDRDAERRRDRERARQRQRSQPVERDW